MAFALSPSSAAPETSRFRAQRPHSLSLKNTAQRMWRSRWGQICRYSASSRNVRRTVPSFVRRSVHTLCQTGGDNVPTLCEVVSAQCYSNVLTPGRAVWRHVAQKFANSGKEAARSTSELHLDVLQQLRTNLCRLRCQVHGRKAERMTLDDDCLIDHRSNSGVQQQAACRVCQHIATADL